MHNHLLRVAARLVLLCALLSTLSVVVVYAWDDNMYFDAISQCNQEAYFDPLDACRLQPGYPISPTEEDCRSASGFSFYSCLNGIPGPTYEPTFCDSAYNSNQWCIAVYGPGSGNQDPLALMDCRTASRVDECQ